MCNMVAVYSKAYFIILDLALYFCRNFWNVSILVLVGSCNWGSAIMLGDFCEEFDFWWG